MPGHYQLPQQESMGMRRWCAPYKEISDYYIIEADMIRSKARRLRRERNRIIIASIAPLMQFLIVLPLRRA